MTSPLVKSASKAMSEKPDVTYADIGGMATWIKNLEKWQGIWRMAYDEKDFLYCDMYIFI